MDEYNVPEASNGPEVGHACNTCRRRKLRCSRELPACQHCRKSASECQYETKRGKPGMKVGALDNIHRRLDALERSVGRQRATIESLEARESNHVKHDPKIQAILSSLATGLQQLTRESSQTPSNVCLQSLPPSKRRRIDEDGRLRYCSSNILPPLPDDTILSHVLKSYFTYIHPWTPIIHEGRFRRRLLDNAERKKLHLVIQSIILVARRYIEDDNIASSLEQLIDSPENARDWLVSQALKQPSVENLQALVVIATNDIGSGQAYQAWPLVGSLSRMVEYMQLTVEHDEPNHHPFSQPYRFLPPPKDWTETEERRRIFWSIFALDRFCSVSMGWNTSLTADDVHRRLPCDGITWRKEDPVITPYFGIWDKSAGRIGNPIAYLPSHPIPSRPAEGEGDAPSHTAKSPGAATSTVDMSTVGAYAYCIEATESLSRVTTYFLQQKVNLNDQKEFSAWLTRFKELDLRLVHWKMLLPQKWTVNVAQQGLSSMDPNLTLAHVTHNTSMILLHQPIAFPLAEWPFKSRLPSLCSMDTCHTAAIEVASITNHYLKGSSATSPVSSQYTFCVFVAAQALLLYWQHTQTESTVAPEFWVLIQNLEIMSARWAGSDSSMKKTNLAARYSATLTQLQQRCAQGGSPTMSITGYTADVNHFAEVPSSQTVSSVTHPFQHQRDSSIAHPVPQSRCSNSNHSRTSPVAPSNEKTSQDLSPRPSFVSSQRLPSPNTFPVNMNLSQQHTALADILQTSLGEQNEDPMTAAQVLLDQDFTGLDRVICYNDGLFGLEYEGTKW